MKQYIRKLQSGIVAAALLAAAGFCVMQARAIEGESIVLSPGSKAFDVKAGMQHSDTFTVINDGTNEYTFRVYASPYSVKSGSYDPNFEDKPENADLYRWVQFEKANYHLKPGEKAEVPFTISVPADARPGGHYGVLFAETQIDESQQSQIGRKKRVGMIAYGTVDGQYVSAGKQISAKIDWLQLGGPLTALVTAENTGNVHYVMHATLRVKNILGQTVYDTTTDHMLLPKTTRDVSSVWKDGPSIGLYQASIETKILDKTVATTSWVLLMPVWLILVAVIMIVTLILLAVRARRR